MKSEIRNPNQAEPIVTRPLVRWHGGKWRLAPWIISQMPAHRIYVEPYGGGASVLLRKPRCYAEVYNDLDTEIVNLFKVVRDNGSELQRRLELTPFAREDFYLAYKPAADPVERARRLVVRSYMGFGSDSHGRVSGFRSNSNRAGTTPAHDWANFPAALGAIIARLRGVVIESRDALRIIQQHDSPGTLHFIDPPYLPETRAPGRRYAVEMDEADHRRLAEVLHQVRGMVILCGYRSRLYDEELYRGWRRLERRALADGARARIEVLWLRNCPDPGWF